MQLIDLGLSPCPNDTFIFHALIHKLVTAGDNLDVCPHFADVEQLNRMAVTAKLPVTKISLGVYPLIAHNYRLLDSGAALGWGVGPLIIAKNGDFDPETARIAIPGRNTTANLLLDLYGRFKGERVEMVFNEIMPAIARGDAELGVIIHEGRFTWQNWGLVKILDLGQWWEQTTALPLPLGAIAIRRDVKKNISVAIEAGIAASVEFAWNNRLESREFIAHHAQELDDSVTRAHIDTFVTTYSKNLGSEGRDAISSLLAGRLPPSFPVGAIFSE